MSNFSAIQTYKTFYGFTSTPTAVTESDLTIPASQYVEVGQRPNSDTVTWPVSVSISGTPLTLTESAAPPSGYFYVEYDTGRVHFNSDVIGETPTISYYGHGTLIRNEHFNSIHANLRSVDMRALCALNSILTMQLSLTSITWNPTTEVLTVPDLKFSTFYALDNGSTVTKDFAITGSALSSFSSGKVAYIAIPQEASPTITISTVAIESFDTTAAAKVIAYNNGSSVMLWNGVTLDTWNKQWPIASETTIQSYARLSTMVLGNKDTTTGDPSVVLHSPIVKTFSTFYAYATNTDGATGPTVIEVSDSSTTGGDNAVNVTIALGARTGNATGTIPITYANQPLYVRVITDGGHSFINLEVV